MTSEHRLRGIACMVLAAGTFVANDTCMKLGMADAPPLQVLAMRGIAACLWCLPLLLILGHGRNIAHVFNRWVLVRCFCEVFAILSFIFALQQMAIADVTAIVQTSPLMVIVGTALIWGDRIGPLRLVLVALGIGGAVLVAQPGASAASPFAIFGFATAIGAAGRDIVSRKVAADIPALIVTFATLLIVMGVAATGTLVFETPVAPPRQLLLLMGVAGFFLMCGHLLIFLAYRYARARVVAPFNYSFTIWAVISGLVVFDYVPNTLALAGMALILLTGLAVVLLEGRTRQGEAPAQNSPSTI